MHGPDSKAVIVAVDMPKLTLSPKRPKSVTKLSLEGISRISEPETFRLPPLLWEEIKQHIHPAEMPTFKRVIGSELIEKNKVLYLKFWATNCLNYSNKYVLMNEKLLLTMNTKRPT